jgi:hypothetical protein
MSGLERGAYILRMAHGEGDLVADGLTSDTISYVAGPMSENGRSRCILDVAEGGGGPVRCLVDGRVVVEA